MALPRGSRLQGRFHEYENDEAAIAAEADFVASFRAGGVECWTDPSCATRQALANLLYHDGTVVPRGAMPADLVEWNRINEGEIKGCSDPRLLRATDDPLPLSPIVQGRLADSWLLSALALLTTRRELLRGVIVSDRHKNAGVYTLRFSKYGKWVYVHIDDRIPCDRTGVPLFSRCADPCEVWVMVIEKAYAKLHGSYLNLRHGLVEYALRDLTGGAPLTLDLPLPPPSLRSASKAESASEAALKQQQRNAERLEELWKFLRTKLSTGGLGIAAGGSFLVKPEEVNGTEPVHGRDGVRGHGLVAGRTYGVLSVHEVEPNPGVLAVPTVAEVGSGGAAGDQALRMVRVLDSWRAKRWSGAWQNDGPLWKTWDDVREVLHPDAWKDDGTFFMTWTDFCLQFNTLHACVPCATREWRHAHYLGKWEAGNTVSGCGGSPNHVSSWPINPQFDFELPDATDVAVVLTQRDYRWSNFERPPSSMVHHAAAVHVCRLTDGKRRVHNLTANRIVAECHTYRRCRQSVCYATLPRGEFSVVPSTFDAGAQGAFELDIYVGDARRGGTQSKFRFPDGDVSLAMLSMPPEPESDDEGSTRAARRSSEPPRTYEEEILPDAGDDIRTSEALELDGLQEFIGRLASQVETLTGSVRAIEEQLAEAEAA